MAGYSSLRGQRQLPGTRGKLVKSAPEEILRRFGGSADGRMGGSCAINRNFSNNEAEGSG